SRGSSIGSSRSPRPRRDSRSSVSGETEGHRMRRSIGCAIVVAIVVASAPSASAAVSWGPQNGIPRAFSWNYGNALDATGPPGMPSFRLTDVFVSDATTPQAAFASSSDDGLTWSRAHRLSGSDVNAENPTVAGAGKKLIAGWMTGFSPYDPIGAARRVQVTVSSDRGATGEDKQALSPSGGAVTTTASAAPRTRIAGKQS